MSRFRAIPSRAPTESGATTRYTSRCCNSRRPRADRSRGPRTSVIAPARARSTTTAIRTSSRRWAPPSTSGAAPRGPFSTDSPVSARRRGLGIQRTEQCVRSARRFDEFLMALQPLDGVPEQPDDSRDDDDVRAARRRQRQRRRRCAGTSHGVFGTAGGGSAPSIARPWTPRSSCLAEGLLGRRPRAP